MNRMKARAILFVGIGLVGGVAQRATADENDQKIVFTFSGPGSGPSAVGGNLRIQADGFASRPEHRAGV
jgi:hypothetical protein